MRPNSVVFVNPGVFVSLSFGLLLTALLEIPLRDFSFWLRLTTSQVMATIGHYSNVRSCVLVTKQFGGLTF